MKGEVALIDALWANRENLKSSKYHNAVISYIDKLDKGELRIAVKDDTGKWQVNETAKKAVILYFLIAKMTKTEIPPFEFHDKIPLR